MIKSFADREAEKLFSGKVSRKFPADIQRIALRKLVLLHAAVELKFLRTPPGNRLEALKDDRAG